MVLAGEMKRLRVDPSRSLTKASQQDVFIEIKNSTTRYQRFILLSLLLDRKEGEKRGNVEKRYALLIEHVKSTVT
jgi:hypothetical protein